MTSKSLERWRTVRRTALDEIEHAHRQVGGAGRGRRFATLQVNHAYVVLLSSQFQGFCRDLHTEAGDCLVIHLGSRSVSLGKIARTNLFYGRKLDRGNPTPSNVGSDFKRLGLDFWDLVRASDSRNPARIALLDELNDWRNAIAHQDFAKVGPSLHLAKVRRWRRALDALAGDFDAVMYTHLRTVIRESPW